MYRRLFAALCLAALVAGGCSHQTDDAQATAPPDGVTSFVSALEATPPAQRPALAAQNSAAISGIMAGNDEKLKTHVKELMDQARTVR